MALFETEGLVLRKYNLSDADRIVIILTEKEGLVRAVAHGVKRLKSKFSGALEFFSRINVTYFQKEDRDLVVLREADLVEPVFRHSSDPEFFESFAEIADLLIRMTPPYEPNKRIYHMTRHCLATAVADRRLVPAVRVYFEIWLLKLGGFLPSWERCADCKRDFGKGVDAGLSIDFQLVCRDCDDGLEVIAAAAREHFQLAQKTSPTAFSKRSLERDDHDLAVLRRTVGRISDAVLERMPLNPVERAGRQAIS